MSINKLCEFCYADAHGKHHPDCPNRSAHAPHVSTLVEAAEKALDALRTAIAAVKKGCK